jgi:alcohol dehydrogenase YqhD (iron-dependent ADH family)
MENGKQPAFAMLDPNGSYTQYGLTKREYFAGLAMQGILAHESFFDRICHEPGENTMADVLATASVKMADKLLAELGKTKQQEQ